MQPAVSPVYLRLVRVAIGRVLVGDWSRLVGVENGWSGGKSVGQFERTTVAFVHLFRVLRCRQFRRGVFDQCGWPFVRGRPGIGRVWSVWVNFGRADSATFHAPPYNARNRRCIRKITRDGA